MTKLPEAFLDRMREMLDKENFEAYLKSFEEPMKKGIRANTLKINREALKERLPKAFEAEEIPWSKNGLYIDSDSRPGKEPEYYTGLYYPQEPSAMSSAEALEIEPGDMVLDLCAAPGGKSTQLGAKLAGTGTLILNEVVSGRVGALISNVERMGIENAVILNENPKRLEERFRERFDKILVDAPCSGEGMFRKDEDVISEWDLDRVAACSRTQRKILDSAEKLLKPGGELVYSTCTFAPEEDERIVEKLVESGDFELLELTLDGVETRGEPRFTEDGLEEIVKTVRIWPQHNKGEGHFVARLKKTGSSESPLKRNFKNKNLKPAKKNELKDFRKFLKEYLPEKEYRERLYVFKDKLYQLPEGISGEDLTGLKVRSPGLLLGELKKNRFEPSHTLSMTLSRDDFSNVYDLEKEELWSYLKGEEITPKREVGSGWVLMCYESYPVGFGKMSGKIKNKYPKGLRIRKK